MTTLDAVRHAILLFMICISAVAAEKINSTASLKAFAAQMRESYEKKDGEWILKHTYTNGVPAEILAASKQFVRAFFGAGKLEVTSVETVLFDDYKPTAAPGEFQGRKLRFVTKPTHWVILKAESPKPKDGSPSAFKTQMKLEFAVFERDGQWKTVGATYAD